MENQATPEPEENRVTRDITAPQGKGGILEQG